jgi:sulfoxide reductase heme-binding subunit YedZ
VGKTKMRASSLPWYDRTGQFSVLRLSVFLLLLVPALWLLIEACTQTLGPRPTTEAIHQAGLWAVRLLAVTLAITPLRHATRFSRLAGLRRMLGLSVLFYALLHLMLYGLDQHGDLLHIASEIALRIYLTIGFVALCGLGILGVTSSDAMIRRLGSKRWNHLHKIVYAIAVLGTVHFFMQVKLDVSEPIIMAGIFALLLGERLAHHFFGDLTALALAALAMIVAGTTAFGEAAWYAYKTGAPVLMILAANLDFSYVVRPVWFVLGAGSVLVLSRLLRPLFVSAARQPAQRLRPAAAQ